MATKLMRFGTVFAASIVLLIGIGLLLKSIPILKVHPLSELLFSSAWLPSQEKFGLFPFIMGTLWVTALVGLIALPVSILSAIYMAEYAPGKVRTAAKSLWRRATRAISRRRWACVHPAPSRRRSSTENAR